MEQQQGNNPSSVPASDELEIIDAEPVSMLPPHYKPRRGQRSKGEFSDAAKIGLPQGWFCEYRERSNAKYLGKVDQFFYEPGTNKQFRSLKSTLRYLTSKGQSIKLVKPNRALQKNAQQKHEALPGEAAVQISNLSNAPPKSINLEPSNKPAMKKKKKKKAFMFNNRKIGFSFKNAPEEVTWVLTNTVNNEWTPFMGETKVNKCIEQYWTETFMMINNVNGE